MDLSKQKSRFYANVFPSRPNTWEVDEIFEQLAELDETAREALLSHVGAIWPVSHSLCFAYLTNGIKALDHIPIDLLGEWVRRILGLYEVKGLLGARQFMADVDKFFLGPMRGEAGVAFNEVSVKMMHYLRGISGRSFELNISPLPSTDTKTIFLPEFLNTFPGKNTNFFLYKFLISLQWGHIESKIFSKTLGPDNVALDLFSHYPNKQLAIDLFAVLQFLKVFRYLEVQLPGLVRQARNLCLRLIKKITPAGIEKAKCFALQSLLIHCVTLEKNINSGDLLLQNAGLGKIDDMLDKDVFDLLPKLYMSFSGMSGSYSLSCAALLLGKFDFAVAGETIRLRREENKDKFVVMLAGLLEQQNKQAGEESEGGNVPASLKENILQLIQEQQAKDILNKKDTILIDNEGLEVPEELAALIKEIKDDLGTLPEAYVQAAAGQAGQGFNWRDNTTREEAVESAAKETHAYDEWDYRRIGYRKDWCCLTEKSLHPVKSGFVQKTLEKYQPQLNKLRRRFEMLRSHDRFIKRRRHGDDIDLDALIEALGDSHAGLAPSDRLFVQLLRDERDIAAMFLVDMSNSTEGWVGVAIKEALVLLAEALEVVGDKYGIYGFSGMRRSKSELFHIKHLHEPYSPEVQGRIAAIGPKEYTRMGPPIRHLTQKLLETQSNVRLLLVISDGKPEDYDDYKGQYAIEDTRKALLEARGCGVHSFCITIDKSAHDYLAHMFGRGNYIFVNNVLSLPAKMSEMYRLLTS
jgi:nitric oxide reductase NorD protein